MLATVAIPDDIVELILLRLDSLVSLVHAATTCKQWRRVVADAVFRRRYRSLHGPPMAAGTYHNGERFERPHFVPSPSATIDGRHFSLDFLPDDTYCIWTVRDCRGSLLLLDRLQLQPGNGGGYSNLVICEPLARRYEIIPPLSTFANCVQLGAFILVDGDDNAEEGCDGMSNFRVLCVVHGHYKTRAGMFTSGSSYWREETFYSLWASIVGLTARSIYLYMNEGRVISMDLRTSEFSNFLLPSIIEGWDEDDRIRHRMTITAGRDNKERIVVVHFGCKVKVYARLDGGSCGAEWALEKTIEISEAMGGVHRHNRDWDLIQTASLSLHRAGSVLIQQEQGGSSRAKCFRLDVETREMELLPDHHDMKVEVPLSPTLRACIDHDDGDGDALCILVSSLYI